MGNKIKQEMNQIEVPKELSNRSKMGITQAKKEMRKSKRYALKSISAAAVLLVSFGAYTLLHQDDTSNQSTSPNIPEVTENGSVIIPAIELPEENKAADMIGLIVYNGKIYTQTRTDINGVNAKAILGEKLGTTKGNIDEWSKQEAYGEEFASTIGVSDVYSVTGYDPGFRIMTFGEYEGEPYAMFFEHLNGITVNNGGDVFGKLKMVGNVSSAKYRTFSDWNNNIDQFYPIQDMDLVNTFVEELNQTKPLARSEHSDPIGETRNDESFKELTIELNDGSMVRLTLLKDGYIYYGFMGVYFEMDGEVFSKMWSQIQ